MSSEARHLSLMARGDPATLAHHDAWATMQAQRRMDELRAKGQHPLSDEEVLAILGRPRDTLGRWITDDERRRMRLHGAG